MDLSTHHDKIINTFNRIISNERDRASDAGADRESIGSLIELAGLNKKATSFAKALHKMEADKRDDVLRSFDALRIELEKNWGGQRTPDMLDGVPPIEVDAVEPAAAGDDDLERFTPDEPRKPSYEADPSFTPADLETDADDFEAQLAEAAQ